MKNNSDVKNNANFPRDCYCSLWQKNPAMLENQGLSVGFCGWCIECGKLGHLCHAPSAPYTLSWCDECWIKLNSALSAQEAKCFEDYLKLLDIKLKNGRNIVAIQADITTLEVDVIVNAANSSLLGGGGVDGAIHRAAGSELRNECALLGGCKVGEAKITKGYMLTARFVVHTVGPVWRGGNRGEPDFLASCYRESIKLAAWNGASSIAFPSISTGVYRYPIDQAAKIAFDTVSTELLEYPAIRDVTFCCFSESDFEIYSQTLSL